MFKSRKVPLQNTIEDSTKVHFDSNSRRIPSVSKYFEEVAREFSAEEKRELAEYLKINFLPYRRGDEYTNDQRNRIKATKSRLVQILKSADFKLSATIPEAAEKVRKDIERYKDMMSEEIARASRVNDELKYAEDNLKNVEEELEKLKTLISEIEIRRGTK